jgi:hypothetical protein
MIETACLGNRNLIVSMKRKGDRSRSELQSPGAGIAIIGWVCAN